MHTLKKCVQGPCTAFLELISVQIDLDLARPDGITKHATHAPAREVFLSSGRPYQLQQHSRFCTMEASPGL